MKFNKTLPLGGSSRTFYQSADGRRFTDRREAVTFGLETGQSIIQREWFDDEPHAFPNNATPGFQIYPAPFAFKARPVLPPTGEVIACEAGPPENWPRGYGYDRDPDDAGLGFRIYLINDSVGGLDTPEQEHTFSEIKFALCMALGEVWAYSTVDWDKVRRSVRAAEQLSNDRMAQARLQVWRSGKVLLGSYQGVIAVAADRT